MSEAPATPKKRPLWARLLRGALWTLAVLLLVGGGGYLYHRIESARRLAAVIAALDADDPGWRADEILGARPEIPEAENSAPRVVAVAAGIPESWPEGGAPRGLSDWPANWMMPPGMMSEVRGILRPVEARREEARRLIDFPRGRHTLTLEEDPIGTKLKDQVSAQRVALILDLDALESAQGGDTRQALLSSRAALNAARSLDEEPVLVVHAIRFLMTGSAMKGIERALALGAVPDADLLALQEALLPHTHGTGLLAGLRGERAIMHLMALRLVEGKESFLEMRAAIQRSGKADEIDYWTWWADRDRARHEHASLLRVLTRVVDAGRLPTPEQADAEDDIAEDVRVNGGGITKVLFADSAGISRAGRRCLACARSLHALVACERYRIENGKWPGRLEDLVPKFLAAVPEDPIAGGPMTYRRLADGVAVESQGHARAEERPRPPAVNGLRLWDVEKRRLPPDVGDEP